jgi:hypothetical protein
MGRRGAQPPYETFTTTQLVAAIDHKIALSRERDESYAATFRKYSPFDWMVGVYLPDVYELNFLHSPGVSENGPFVRFAEAVLNELKITKSNGEPYKRATISKARRNVRAGQIRRRIGSNELEYQHWALSLVAEAYRNSATPDDAQEEADPTAPQLEIVDPIKLMEYLLSKNSRGFKALLLKLADEDAEKGIAVPGYELVKVILPNDGPSGDDPPVR